MLPPLHTEVSSGLQGGFGDTTARLTTTWRRRRARPGASVPSAQQLDRLLGTARAGSPRRPGRSLEEIARRAEGESARLTALHHAAALLEAVFPQDVGSARAPGPTNCCSRTPSRAQHMLPTSRQAGGAVVRSVGDDHDARRTSRSPSPRSDKRERAALSRATARGHRPPRQEHDDLIRLVSAVALSDRRRADGSAQAEALFALLMNGVRDDTRRSLRPGYPARGRSLMAINSLRSSRKCKTWPTTGRFQVTSRRSEGSQREFDGRCDVDSTARAEQTTLPPDLMTEVMERIGGTEER